MAGMVYAWKPGAHAPVSAQDAGEELSRIRAAQGRFFTPAAVVLASRPADAPLHKAFEWDDCKAASAHRSEQARYLIRSVVILDPDWPDQEPIRAFVSVRLENDTPSYTTMAHAMSNADLREQVLGQALADMQTFERKYSQILDLSHVASAFKKAMVKAAAPESRRAG